MKWYENYDTIFEMFEQGYIDVDETSFYFRSDPKEQDRFIGFLPEYEKPYWVGLCDIPDGCEFATAKELFEARIYDSQSLKERWSDVVLCMMNGVDVDSVNRDWFKRRWSDESEEDSNGTAHRGDE